MLKLKKLWSLQLTNGSLVLHRRYNSLSPFSFPKRVNKRHLRAQPTQTPVLPRTTYYSPRSQNCRLPPPSKRQVRKSKQKVLKTGFRWQCLSPSGQLLGTPGRPTTVGRTPSQTVLRPWAHLLTLLSVPAALEGVRGRGRGERVGEEETSTVKMTAERAGRGERPGRMLGVEP